MQEMSLVVVGIDYPNGDGSNRRSEAMMTLPGEPVALLPDPKNKHDNNAIAVVSPRGVQIGYLSAERAPYIGGRMSRGEDLAAIFQGVDGGAAFIRVRFGGGAPTLPTAAKDVSPALARQPRQADLLDPHAFYPDDEGNEWGA